MVIPVRSQSPRKPAKKLPHPDSAIPQKPNSPAQQIPAPEPSPEKPTARASTVGNSGSETRQPTEAGARRSSSSSTASSRAKETAVAPRVNRGPPPSAYKPTNASLKRASSIKATPVRANGSQDGPTTRHRTAPNSRSISFDAASPSSEVADQKFKPSVRAPSHSEASTVVAPSSTTIQQASPVRTKSTLNPQPHLQPTTPRRVSIQTQPLRPPFNTYQRTFTPSKQIPSTTPRRTSTSSSNKATKLPTAPTAPTLSTLRRQTHLLHLTLLHQAFPSTQKAWLASAHTHLSTLHAQLQQSYASQLSLARAARQNQNLLALHRWSGGNGVALTRKLGALADVLGEIWAMIKEEGRWSKLVGQFEAWTEWVRGVWAVRDEECADSDEEGRGKGVAEKGKGKGGFTKIEGLGDGVKAEMKALGQVLERMAMKLEDVRTPPIALLEDVVTGEGEVGGVEVDGSCDERSRKSAPVTPTPRLLCDFASQFVYGMREELQAMREAEFEVVVGEKAWVDQRVRRIGGEIGAGFG